MYTCPNCGTPLNENIHHCLENCGAYMSMSVNERVACVEKANSCPIYLMGAPNFSEYDMKIDPRYFCGVDDCALHYHKSLLRYASCLQAGSFLLVNCQ